MKIEEKIVHSIVSTKVNIHYNEELKRTAFYDKQVKMYGNRYLNHIIGKEKFFDGLEEAKEDQAITVHDVFYDYIKAVCAINIPDMAAVTSIIEAYLKDPKSIEGIVSKVLVKNN